jgi:hypothetical protein
MTTNIPSHILKMPQRKRILKLLKDRGSQGVYVWELTRSRPDGLGCQQYNARILELRRQGYNIVNKVPGHFVLEGMITPKAASTTFESIKSIELESEVVTPKELKGETRKQWLAVGAYLRGEGPKPEAVPQLEELVQEALL